LWLFLIPISSFLLFLALLHYPHNALHIMPSIELPQSPLATLQTIELTGADEALLQRFFDANPAYFLAVHGEVAGPGEAHEEIHGPLPAGWPYSKIWLIGYVNAEGELQAMANVVSDLLAPGVWHIGTFIVATSRHGTGDAQLLFRGLQNWATAHGAQWLRLGVVQGHTRAERFWQSSGFVQTRTRSGVVMGQRTNTLRVMVKPLAGGSLDNYLALIGRDRPEA
jgi:GNAT superfamily N-acetyltransferase